MNGFAKKLTLLIFILIPSVEAEQSLQVVTEGWWPFNYVDETGELVGSSTVWVKSVLEKAKIPYHLDMYPWHRSYNLALKRKNVLIYSIFRSPKRESLFHWVCSLPEKPVNKIYKLSSRSDIVVKNNEDLHNYSVNVIRGAYTHDYLLSLGLTEERNIHLAADNDANVNKLLLGRVDLIVDFDHSIQRILKENGLQTNHVEVVHTFKKDPKLCMAISKGTPQTTVDRIKNAHQALLEQNPQ
ncbi:amino acid ABC transporter substrate-binding protein [Thalassotalea sp. M1531]|uniref:Amino acid ABC transporter substrate-binding protein n=1 Tax=Thalassotalea algicola TaxID=2716224 RepID=A0A7Y0LBR6_9GAMM|nr:transporter substrate-binding domain-containing protein [Thalassotalea algicola]NMP31283.1 amino acid ABC transporter substrate-binding protein [Thalassotalea algicola]